MDRGWLLCDTAGVVGWFCLPSTGSPFGHHPRLRMMCPLWGQWVSTWRRFACLRPCISCKSVDAHTTSPPQQHPHRETLASGGGVPCLTAGDARRVNPWRRGQRELRRRRRCTASVEQPHKSTLASGGGAPCLTAGDARRVNPWKEDRENSDAGGVALQAWREKLRWVGVAAVRHRRCRRVVLSTFHGFALWASPAVKHGVSPLGTVDEHVTRSCPSSLRLLYIPIGLVISIRRPSALIKRKNNPTPGSTTPFSILEI